jgi:hypothetical protein
MTNIVDFDALAYSDTAKYEVKHPDPKVKAALGTITVAGPGHPQVLDFEESERRRSIEELQAYQIAAREAIDAGNPVPPTPDEKRTVADIRQRNAERLAAHVVDADFSVKIDGKVVEFTRETAASILSNPRIPFIYEGLFRFVNARENFIGNSAKA